MEYALHIYVIYIETTRKRRRTFFVNYRSKIRVDQNNRCQENAGKFCRNIISSEISSKSPKKPGISSKFVSTTFAQHCTGGCRPSLFMRNKMPGAGMSSDDHVFISYTANAMSSSMISTQLNSFWQKATDKLLVRVNAAAFRKAAVSAVHEEHGHLKKDLADLMGYNQKTAEKFYLNRQ